MRGRGFTLTQTQMCVFSEAVYRAAALARPASRRRHARFARLFKATAARANPFKCSFFSLLLLLFNSTNSGNTSDLFPMSPRTLDSLMHNEAEANPGHLGGWAERV